MLALAITVATGLVQRGALDCCRDACRIQPISPVPECPACAARQHDVWSVAVHVYAVRKLSAGNHLPLAASCLLLVCWVVVCHVVVPIYRCFPFSEFLIVHKPCTPCMHVHRPVRACMHDSPGLIGACRACMQVKLCTGLFTETFLPPVWLAAFLLLTIWFSHQTSMCQQPTFLFCFCPRRCGFPIQSFQSWD